MPRPGSDASGRDLPAPYVSPWRLLRQDLVALLASLRLKLQELWRRNAYGDLPRPVFWPDRLAVAFWPLLVALMLALLLAGIGLGSRLLVLPRERDVAERPIAAALGPSAAIASAGSSLDDGGARSTEMVAPRQPTIPAPAHETHPGVDAALSERMGKRDRRTGDGLPEQPTPLAPTARQSPESSLKIGRAHV